MSVSETRDASALSNQTLDATTRGSGVCVSLAASVGLMATKG